MHRPKSGLPEDEWITVVPPERERRARALFDEWRVANREWAKKLRNEDIRVDIMRATEGRTLWRYRVRPPK